MNKLLSAWYDTPDKEKMQQMEEFLDVAKITLFGVSLNKDAIRKLQRNLKKRGLDATQLQREG